MSDLKNTVEESFTRYAGNVILDRAICDVRDMLKPAARMLMYSQLHITKNTSDKPFVKSARVVGDALGHYYAHGDSSCYGTYMRMAKPFAMRYPLEECQGNSGTVASTKDEAASRYTELRLSKIGNSLFTDIEKDTIDRWNDNFDETEKYPSVLPSKGFYNIVNGTLGIAVGIGSSIPQFNLREVNNALIKLLWNENAPDSQVIVMPDFATGGILLNTKEVFESLKNGNGKSAVIRSVIDYNAKEHYFKVKEIPYGVYTNTITEQIQALLEENPDCGIEGINDGSSDKPDYIIYINKNANPDQILQLLYKNTSLQDFYTINMAVLKDGRSPKIMGLREMFLEHLKHEKEIYIRSYNYDKKKIEDRLHIIDGLLICMANIDEVVHIIKSSASSNDAAIALQQKFLLDSYQTKAILDMKLSRLAHLEVQKLENEKQSLLNERAQIEEILNNEDLLKKEIEKGLRNVAVKYGDDRRTKIENSIITNGEEIEVKQSPLAIFLTSDQRILAINLENYKTTAKGTKGTLVDKNIVAACCTKTNSTIVLTDIDGNIYGLNTNLIPCSATGIPVSSLVNCSEITQIANFEQKDYLVLITEKGYIKKSLLSEYNFSKKLQSIKLKESDKIVKILFVNKQENILLVNEAHKVNNYSIEALKTSSRVTYGTLGNGLTIDATVAASEDEILTYDLDGKGKKTLLKDIPTNSRVGAGAASVDNLIGIHKINGQHLILVSDGGRIISLNSDDITLHSFKSLGSKLLSGKIIVATSI